MDYELTEIDNAETGEQEELELHPEEVRQRQDTYSSLTDLSQIHLFTSEFKNRMEEKERREEDHYIELSEEVFMQAVRGKGSEELKLQLFTGEQDQKLLHDYGEISQGSYTFEVLLMSGAILLIVILYAFFFKRGKEAD